MVSLVYNLVVLFFFGCLFSQPALVDGVVAVVGSRAVFASDVEKRMLEIEQEYLSRGFAFSLSQLSVNERLVFKRDVLSVLVGDRLILIAAEQDTNISVGYDQINAFLDENIQNIIDFKFGGSVLEFEKNTQTTASKYKADQWEFAKNMLLTEEKKRSLLEGVGVTKKEILNSFEFYKKENPLIPQSFSFSLYETLVLPKKEDLIFNINKLSSIKDSLVSGVFLFEDAVKKHSKKTPLSDALNGWWMRGELGSVFPKNTTLEKTLFSLSVGEISSPVETRLGFHLFFLEDRAGEKIKLQQLFLPLGDVLVDVAPVIEIQKNLLFLCENDPGLFDSLVVENSILYKDLKKENLSGLYNDVSFENTAFLKNPFYRELSVVLEKTPNQSFSGPFVFKNSVFLVYKYFEERERALKEEDLYGRWSFFEDLALQNKRNLFIEEWITKQKKHFYVEIFD